MRSVRDAVYEDTRMAKAGAGGLSQAVPSSIDGVASGSTGRVVGVPQGACGRGSGRGRGSRRGWREDVCVEHVMGGGRSMARSQLPPQAEFGGIVQGVCRDGGTAVHKALD